MIMNKLTFGRRTLLAAAAATMVMGGPAFAASHQIIDQIHF